MVRVRIVPAAGSKTYGKEGYELSVHSYLVIVFGACCRVSEF